jgi:hypothetical protein
MMSISHLEFDAIRNFTLYKVSFLSSLRVRLETVDLINLIYVNLFLLF